MTQQYTAFTGYSQVPTAQTTPDRNPRMSSKYSSYYPSAPASGSGSLGAYRARSNTQSLPEFGFTIKNINMDVSERRNNGEHWWPPQMSSAYTDIDSTRSFWYTPQTQNNASHWYECNPPQWSQLRSTQTLGRLAIASVFWYNPTRQFLALNADATTEDETPECWREIRFRKPDEVQDFQSHADFTGSYQSLMSKAHPEARWPGHLLPEAYNYVSESLEAQSIYHENNSQEPPAHGISGNLAILFAIVGFTGPRGRILEILQHSCEDQVWRPHNFEDDRRDHKPGKVVEVFGRREQHTGLLPPTLIDFSKGRQRAYSSSNQELYNCRPVFI